MKYPARSEETLTVPSGAIVQVTTNALYVIAKPRELISTLRELALSYDRLSDLVHRTAH